MTAPRPFESEAEVVKAYNQITYCIALYEKPTPYEQEALDRLLATAKLAVAGEARTREPSDLPFPEALGPDADAEADESLKDLETFCAFCGKQHQRPGLDRNCPCSRHIDGGVGVKRAPCFAANIREAPSMSDATKENPLVVALVNAAHVGADTRLSEIATPRLLTELFVRGVINADQCDQFNRAAVSRPVSPEGDVRDAWLLAADVASMIRDEYEARGRDESLPPAQRERANRDATVAQQVKGQILAYAGIQEWPAPKPTTAPRAPREDVTDAEARRMAKDLASRDDELDWKFGGDGDNGEALVVMCQRFLAARRATGET